MSDATSNPDNETPPAPRGFLKRGGRAIAVWTAVIIAIVWRFTSAGSNDSGLDSLRVGDCIGVPEENTFGRVTTVACSTPHTRQIYAIGDTSTTIDLTDTAPSEVSQPEIDRICRVEVAPTVLALIASTPAAQTGYLIGNKRTGRVVCVVITPSRTDPVLPAIGTSSLRLRQGRS
jgi:hypothetical protein